MFRNLAIAILVAGCGGSNSGVSGGADFAWGGDMAMMAPSSIRGIVIDLDAKPIADVVVRLCGQSPCRETKSDAAGRFSFADAATGAYRLSAVPPDARHAPITVPIYSFQGMGDGFRRLVLPAMPAGTEVAPGAQSIVIDSSLTLSVDGGALVFPGTDRHLAGVRIPDAIVPEFCVPSLRIAAVYAFTPAGTTSTAPVDFTLSDSLGLGAKTVVSLYTVNLDTGVPDPAGSAVTGGDGASIHSRAGDGFRRFTWLLLGTLAGGP